MVMALDSSTMTDSDLVAAIDRYNETHPMIVSNFTGLHGLMIMDTVYGLARGQDLTIESYKQRQPDIEPRPVFHWNIDV